MQMFNYLPPEVYLVFRTTAIAGFVTASVLLININHRAFKWVLKEKSITYWWLFTVFTIVPLLMILQVFSIFFGR
jgi:hypothetical protein